MEDKKKNSIITQKDILILKKLFEDGRMSSSSISKEIDLGREIVNYRIKRLIKENLIVKFIPKINEKAMHYNEYIILLKLNLDDDISKENFIKENIGNKYLAWTIKSKSGWDLIIRLYAASIDEFKEKLSEILEGYSDILANYYTIITSSEIKETEKETVFENLFNEHLTKNDFAIIKGEQKLLQIDDKDKQIIDLLENDARAQYKDIAEKVGVSSDTVKYRIDKLKEQGIIQNIIPIINYNKIGLVYCAAIIKFNFLNKDDELEICRKLKNDKHIIRAIKNLNSDEFFLNLVFDNEKEKNKFEEKIKDEFKGKLNLIEIFKIE
jgi:Lrp/AsnC family leucine-responsive transcriptional regulator